MPQIITVDSQVPESTEIALCWGDLAETPPTGDIVRLQFGENFTIPEGYATSIRTKEGWQRGYALTDTAVTGPVDISSPVPMSRREFAPRHIIDTLFGSALMMAYFVATVLLVLILTQGVATYGMLAQVSAFLGGSTIGIFAFWALIKFLKCQDEKFGLNACANASPKTFWRDDLEWVQSQPIRATGVA